MPKQKEEILVLLESGKRLILDVEDFVGVMAPQPQVWVCFKQADADMIFINKDKIEAIEGFDRNRKYE